MVSLLQATASRWQGKDLPSKLCQRLAICLIKDLICKLIELTS